MGDLVNLSHPFQQLHRPRRQKGTAAGVSRVSVSICDANRRDCPYCAIENDEASFSTSFSYWEKRDRQARFLGPWGPYHSAQSEKPVNESSERMGQSSLPRSLGLARRPAMKSSRVCWRPGPSGFSRNKYTLGSRDCAR